MKIRKFNKSDIAQITELFYQTVHTINKKDYTQEQLDAWVPKDQDYSQYLNLHANIAYVVEIDGTIAGFADAVENGYIDRLYVHKDFQRQGIATFLLKKLEQVFKQLNTKEFSADVSITARPFFEKHGYKVVKEHYEKVRGVYITYFNMSKKLLN
jgi:putative acetyltransferase